MPQLRWLSYMYTSFPVPASISRNKSTRALTNFAAFALLTVPKKGRVNLISPASSEKYKIEASDFIWDFGKLPFSEHLGKYFIKIGKISAKIHKIGKIKAIFGLGMTLIEGDKNGQIKSLEANSFLKFYERK